MTGSSNETSTATRLLIPIRSGRIFPPTTEPKDPVPCTSSHLNHRSPSPAFKLSSSINHADEQPRQCENVEPRQIEHFHTMAQHFGTVWKFGQWVLGSKGMSSPCDRDSEWTTQPTSRIRTFTSTFAGLKEDTCTKDSLVADQR
ncbi:hypothetical protein TNCV_2654381 [Trichonephila clavipes]|nr:hypothetical protein TNCV_2654381 [Trichonephila clavipes]